MKRIRIVQFGLGPIGVEALKLASEQSWLEIVGAVDIAPQKAGRPLTDLVGNAAPDGLMVSRDLDELFGRAQPDLILHTASSSAASTLAQMRPALERGVSVASTCEELIFPLLKAGALVEEYDALCRRNGARVVATGVNPGFVMDVLPICLTAVSRTVEKVEVTRVVDAATRRQPLQAKIGSGQPAAVFREKLRDGRAGHAGLRESVALVGHALGWKLDSIVEQGEPVVAAGEMRTAHFTVQPGETCGIHQRAVGTEAGVERVVLDIKMYLEAPEPHDRVVLSGRPALDVVLRGGVPGDEATIAALINVVPRLLASAPGLHLATGLALPRWAGGHGNAAAAAQ